MRNGKMRLLEILLIFVSYVPSLEIQINFSPSLTHEEDSVNYKKIERSEKHDYDQLDDRWMTTVIKDIAYYLRNHKFNEWDRRLYLPPANDKIGFYSSFPEPPLNTLHWRVVENCDESFVKCIIYLQGAIETPFREVNQRDTHVKMSVHIIDSGRSSKELQFENPLELFQWRTTASYYMCWYTMKEVPDLSMIGESCDNFAEYSDDDLHNQDIRSDDRQPFACALYSFCPDPCCPVKQMIDLIQCDIEDNPCFITNSDKETSARQCHLDRKENQNLHGMINNKWNVTCKCEDPGFNWNSQFGMCVDINECVTGEHSCDVGSEECINLPGTFQCVCKWGYKYDDDSDKCILYIVVPKNKEPV